MATSLTRELQTTGDALRIALEQRRGTPAILIQLMHDFAKASEKAFEAKSHSLVGFAAEQLKACSRGFLRTLERDGSPEVIAMALELFPMGSDYLDEALESLQQTSPTEFTQDLLGAIFRNLSRHETLFNDKLRGTGTSKILERGLRLSAGLTKDEFAAGEVSAFIGSLVEFNNDAIAHLERTERAVSEGNKCCIESTELLMNWIESNEDFLCESVTQNQVTDLNTDRLIEKVRKDYELPRLAAALAFRTNRPTFEDLHHGYEKGLRADVTFRTGVIPSDSSSLMSQATFKALIAYSMVYEDVMPETIVLDPNASGLKALRAAGELLDQPEYKLLPRVGDIQKIVDQVIDATPLKHSMDPLVGTWAERYAINNLTYRARLFTQELGV